MKLSKYIAAAAIVSLLCAFCVQAAPPGSGWSVNWGDEFNHWGSPNSGKWNVSHRIDWNKNGKKCWFDRGNTKVNGNALVIENHWQGSTVPSGYHYSGGWIKSKPMFKFGWYEARSRLDWKDHHFWPSFWMAQDNNNKVIDEFDIMEYQRTWDGGSTPTQSHHYRKLGGGHITKVTNAQVSQWHNWGLLWFSNHVSFWVDGVKHFDSPYAASPADNNMPIIVSCSPNRDSQPTRNGNYPRFFVDWVRVYKGGSVGGGGGGGSTAPIGKTIALKSKGSNKFVKAQGGKGWVLEAVNGSVGGAWEKFACVDAGGGYIALKSLGSNKYVQANGGNGWIMKATNGTIGGSWEKFTWHPQSDGSIALKCQGSGKYVQANGGAGWRCQATNGHVGGSWEKFTWSQH